MATEQEREAALSVLRKDYWDDVRSIVENLKDEIRRGVITAEERALEWIEQTCDGHERVIYTRQAIETLLFCESEEDAHDACALEGVTEPTEIYTCLAFYGLRGDVLKNIGDVGSLFEGTDEE